MSQNAHIQEVINSGRGFIYFIKALDSSMVKIGRTRNNPILRKKEIQNMSPVKLRIIGALACKDPNRTEREFHELFAPIRSHGEWFEFEGNRIGTLKKSICTGRGNGAKFDYISFVEYWKREMSKESWI